MDPTAPHDEMPAEAAPPPEPIAPPPPPKLSELELLRFRAAQALARCGELEVALAQERHARALERLNALGSELAAAHGMATPIGVAPDGTLVSTAT